MGWPILQVFEPNLVGGRKMGENDFMYREPIENSPSGFQYFDTTALDTLLLANRVYPGIADPQDRSHFTIDYETSERKRGTIDGWLDDNNVIRLKARPGPIDVRAFWKSMEDNM